MPDNGELRLQELNLRFIFTFSFTANQNSLSSLNTVTHFLENLISKSI
jgi:hypothetical protein